MTTVNNIIVLTLHVTVYFDEKSVLPVPTASSVMFLLAHVFVIGFGPDLSTDMSLSYVTMLYVDVVGICAIYVISRRVLWEEMA